MKRRFFVVFAFTALIVVNAEYPPPKAPPQPPAPPAVPPPQSDYETTSQNNYQPDEAVPKPPEPGPKADDYKSESILHVQNVKLIVLLKM